MKSIPCPISSDELHALVHDDKLTDKVIADRLGETKKRVQSWRGGFGIESLPRWKRNKVTPIKGRLKSVLVGSMLGDGRIVRQKTASYYTEGHCEAQVSYLKWKADLWGQWVKFDPPVYPVPSKEGYPQFCMRTCAHGSLNAWQEMFYADHKKGWKRLVPEVVEHIDAFALAIWYLDDGHAGWWPGFTFGAGDASLEVAWAIFEKFGLKPRWGVKKGKTGQFHMERDETAERFIEIIRPHVPACMAYKLGPFGFQGQHYQIRKRLSEEVLRDGVAEGVPIARMARGLGVSASSVRRKLQKMGVPYSPPRGRPKPQAPWLKGPKFLVAPHPCLLQDEAPAMWDLIQRGMLIQEVAGCYGVGKDTVRRRLREAGYPHLKPGPKSETSLAVITQVLKSKYPDTSLWNNLDKVAQEQQVSDVLSVLRRGPFPFPEVPAEHIWERNWKRLQQDPSGLTLATTGLKLCYPFFPNRYTACYRGRISAFEAWHQDKALKAAIRWQFKVGDPVVPHRVLRAVTANCRTPTVFRPMVARYLYGIYCPPGGAVWDPCAGFGGRLLGALASDATYVATEVDPETLAGNQRLAEHFGAVGRVSLHLCPAEEFNPPDVDFVFTSPPYYHQERYQGGEQSWKKYGTVDEWGEGFLRPLLERARQAVDARDGKVALNIADVKTSDGVVPLESMALSRAQEVGLRLVATLKMPLARLNKRDPWEPIFVWNSK